MVSYRVLAMYWLFKKKDRTCLEAHNFGENNVCMFYVQLLLLCKCELLWLKLNNEYRMTNNEIKTLEKLALETENDGKHDYLSLLA